MKVDIFLVKDEYSTVANFRCSTKAAEYASRNKCLIVERIEVELPKFRYQTTAEVVNIPVAQQSDLILSPTDKVEDVINTHVLNVYNRLGKNKTHTAKAVGLAIKTVIKRLRGINND